MNLGQMDCFAFIMSERLLFYRELGAKAYGPFAYFISLWLLQLPVIAISVFAYCAVLYPMAGLRPGGLHFFTFYFFMLMGECAFHCLTCSRTLSLL